jgi:hypothetical protein
VRQRFRGGARVNASPSEAATDVGGDGVRSLNLPGKSGERDKLVARAVGPGASQAADQRDEFADGRGGRRCAEAAPHVAKDTAEFARRGL